MDIIKYAFKYFVIGFLLVLLVTSVVGMFRRLQTIDTYGYEGGEMVGITYVPTFHVVPWYYSFNPYYAYGYYGPGIYSGGTYVRNTTVINQISQRTTVVRTRRGELDVPRGSVGKKQALSTAKQRPVPASPVAKAQFKKAQDAIVRRQQDAARKHADNTLKRQQARNTTANTGTTRRLNVGGGNTNNGGTTRNYSGGGSRRSR